MPFVQTGFPEYQFREFPKQIDCPDGKSVVAEHAQHEAEIRAGFAPAEASEEYEHSADPEASEGERQMLLQECVARGIKVHPKTGIAKLKAALA